ncbi:MAG: formylmethanofuran dehydrogenase subunit E family protein [Desulfobacterales bacterium]|nr:formylmethanofuran dehydrogenase subunit E family protein [Desulfobacterales bacterium]
MENQDILNDTFKFHGHICWASAMGAMGARAGLVTLRELGAQRAGSSGELHCIVEIGENHAAQCFADGVQYSTGCTLGKGNISKMIWNLLF